MNANEQNAVLLVEDDHAIRGDLKTLLELEGYKVEIAENGKRALDFLKTQATLPSLILLDIMMPVMGGWEFREAQMNDPKFSLIPVVVMTADIHAPVKAAQMKTQGFIPKPIDIDRLLQTVEKFVRG